LPFAPLELLIKSAESAFCFSPGQSNSLNYAAPGKRFSDKSSGEESFSTLMVLPDENKNSSI